MKKRAFQRLLKLTHRLNDAGLEQRVQVTKAQHLFLQRIEAAQDLDMFFRKRWQFGVRQNFNERDLERRKRQRSVQTVAALLPLARDARMTIEEGGDNVGLIAVGVAAFFFADEIPQHGFSDFRVGVVVKGTP